MDFPPSLSSLQGIFQLLKDSFSTSDVLMRKIELAVEEVVVNIISYSGSPRLAVEVAEANGVVCITIRDWGAPFNPLSCEEKKQKIGPIEEMTEGGLGIFFLKQVMDEVTYERRDDQNILKLKKTLVNTQEASA